MTSVLNRRYGARVGVIVALWFVVALSASALSLFRVTGPAPALPSAAIAALIPVAVFVAALAASPAFRRFALSLDPRILTVVQAWRANGFLFLVLAAYGILPNLFALPAGWGDMTIGVTAPLVAIYLAKPSRRLAFIGWQALGMLDLLMAITLGAAAARGAGSGAGMAAMTVLPLSLIPTFIVPLLAMLHITAIVQAAGWARSPALAVERPLLRQARPA